MIEEEKKERFDSPSELDEKVTRLAEMVKESEYFVAFTGAGISLDSSDYRPGLKTVAPTNFKTNVQKASPSLAHMTLVQLMNRGTLKHIIT